MRINYHCYFLFKPNDSERVPRPGVRDRAAPLPRGLQGLRGPPGSRVRVYGVRGLLRGSRSPGDSQHLRVEESRKARKRRRVIH